MEEEKIILLNKIWAQRRLDTGFFLEKILPIMLDNWETGQFDREEVEKGMDILFTVPDNPFHVIFLCRILRPKIIVVLMRQEKDVGSDEEKWQRRATYNIIAPNCNCPVLRINVGEPKNFEDFALGTLPGSFSLKEIEEKIIPGSGRVIPGDEEYPEKKLFQAMLFVTPLSYFYGKYLERIIGEMKDFAPRSSESLAIDVLLLVNISSLLPGMNLPTTAYTGPTAGWQKSHDFLELHNALGREVVTIFGGGGVGVGRKR